MCHNILVFHMIQVLQHHSKRHKDKERAVMQELCFYTFSINQIQSYTVKFCNCNYIEMCKHGPCGGWLSRPTFRNHLKYIIPSGVGLALHSRIGHSYFNIWWNKYLARISSHQVQPRPIIFRRDIPRERAGQGQCPDPLRLVDTRIPCHGTAVPGVHFTAFLQ